MRIPDPLIFQMYWTNIVTLSYKKANFMPLSVRLTNEEEALLDAAARRTALSRSALVRQAVRELCQRLARADKTPYDLGKRLFGAGTLASVPNDPVKRAVWEKLLAKHRRVG